MNYVSEHRVGEFTLESDKLRVTDPCYTKGTWCAGVINARPGKWNAQIKISNEGGWGDRVAELMVTHENYAPSKNAFWVTQEFSVGVDSGQAGFFDDAKYPNGDETGEYGDTDTFYGKVCTLTHSETNRRQVAGTLDFGVASSSGYGDGGYRCEAIYNGDEVVAARIIFIGDEEDEEDEEE